MKKRGVHCIMCGEQLSMVKRLTKADFCSTDHQEQYRDLLQREMLARLQSHQTQLDAAQLIASDEYAVLKRSA